VKRREFLGAASVAALLPVTFARASTRARSRFVLVILRGALDGLAAVPPHGDPAYAALRGPLALRVPGFPGGALPLNSLFGLHPSFKFLHASFLARELIVFHAVATPYRERSHFDGQDVLESGFVKPHAVQTGWLNRSLAALPAPPRSKPGVALGQNLPLVMRGPAEVTSWSPSKLAALDEDTLQRITDLYANDPLLSTRLGEALAADAIAKTRPASPGTHDEAMSQMDRAPDSLRAGAPGTWPPAVAGNTPDQPGAGPSRANRYDEIVRAAAGFLRREDGPQVAVFDTTGWDTHANEGGAEGQLANRLRVLDAALGTLKAQLGPTWADTAILLVTEFGRTAATNGTRGTDHGTATAAWLLGGAIKGGRVIADWPGLSARTLHEGRDLKPTLDLRSVLKGVLQEHLLIPKQALSSSVFPDSASARPLSDLVRT